MSAGTIAPPPQPPAAPPPAAPPRPVRRTSLLAHGESMVWLTGGALALCVAMIVGLLLLVLLQGIETFWPVAAVRIRTADGKTLMGEVTREESYRPRATEIDALPPDRVAAARAATADGTSTRRLVRIGNYELTGEHFAWVSDFQVAEETLPEWAIVVERLSWGRFYGELKALVVDGEAPVTEPAAAWARFEEVHGGVRERRERRRDLEIHAIGDVNRELEAARLALESARLAKDAGRIGAAQAELDRTTAASEIRFGEIREEIARLDAENAKYRIVLVTADGTEKALSLAEVVRAYPANRLGFGDEAAVYASRWGEFLSDEPREANSEGGVFPAIFGTVTMTLIMSLLVVPFGVLAALYLREYAKPGFVVSTVRIAINNLAGVPSIVFGVFGLGFFCYTLGGTVDSIFFEEKLPTPTYGTGGILWASLTLALLTLPVVIVATEEALSAVPGSMREGSYACGASKWQTIQRIVLPRALPGIMTGAILAMARGAGEVAPLMLVGAVKLAPELPVDGIAPFVHPDRSFMHLGFHIYDLGFQSQNSEAARPMVYTTTLLLIAIIVVLNIAAIWVRGRLRRKFVSAQF